MTEKEIQSICSVSTFQGTAYGLHILIKLMTGALQNVRKLNIFLFSHSSPSKTFFLDFVLSSLQVFLFSRKWNRSISIQQWKEEKDFDSDFRKEKERMEFFTVNRESDREPILVS